VRASHPPWWLYIIAASFLSYSALVIYSCVWGPSDLGMGTDDSNGAMVVRKVVPDGATAHAGLRVDDRIVAANGIPVRGRNYFYDFVTASFEPESPIPFDIEREGKQIELAVTMRRGSLRDLNWEDGQVLGFEIFTLVLALVVAFRRPHDPVARWGAWSIASLVFAVFAPGYGWASAWRQWPAPLGILLWPAFVTRFSSAAICLTFVAVFPRKLFRVRWVWGLIWTPIVFVTAIQCLVYARLLYHPNGPPNALAVVDLDVWRVLTLCYIPVICIVWVINYRRLTGLNERRRMRVLFAGVLVFSLVLLAMLILELSPARVTAAVYTTPVLVGLLFSLLLVLPLSFAYAILRHRVFDLGTILRRGLQYALARRLLVSAVPTFAAIFLLDLVLHGDQPTLTIFRERGWMYAALAALAAIAYRRRQRWLEALDRRFFRERYDARQLLREVVEEVHAAQNLEQEASLVVARIEAALHPEFAALLVCEPREVSYHTLAAAPTGQGPQSLPKESKLLALVRLLGKPLEVPQTESGWLQQQLPHEETEFLRRSRIDLLVPVAVDPQHTEVLLVLGGKRSEEPYSDEDQDLLVDVAASLAILVKKPTATTAARRDLFEECPQCGMCYDDGTMRCTQEGSRLVPVILPRLLGERYRLERRIGRGGMGTVYKAHDVALDREVAVKLIREELVANSEAAQRFHREAKVAASFSHPAVVTVHDFGVHGESRAFLVMEFLRGRTLRDEMNQVKRMPSVRTFSLVKQVCAALEAAHQRQIVHRDLKPENIFLVDGSGEELIKILDFGLAKFLSLDAGQSTVTLDTGIGQLLGTPSYMCPEQLKSSDVNPGWDLWALSVVAYEMLIGTRPFAGSSIVECHRAVVAGNFIPIHKVVADAPPRWNEFFTSSFSLEPVHRPQTATQWLALFEQKVIDTSGGS
jgi:tRNA A-37 threonylcarbamoyl transferase component Bud32